MKKMVPRSISGLGGLARGRKGLCLGRYRKRMWPSDRIALSPQVPCSSHAKGFPLALVICYPLNTAYFCTQNNISIFHRNGKSAEVAAGRREAKPL